MERIHSQKKPVCSQDAFQHLAEVMNQNKDRVRVRTKHLVEVLACHARSGPRPPRDLMVESRGRRAIVERQVLFNFVVDHGECCGTQVEDGWESPRVRREHRLANRQASK